MTRTRPWIQELFSIRGLDDEAGDVMSNDGRHLLAGGTGDLLRQMHRMRHQDHKDEGLNLTRSMLAGRTSKINNRTKARFIRMKKAAAPPKPSKKPKRIPAPVADGDAASGAAPGPEAPSLDLGDGEYDEWTDEDFADDFNDDDYLEDILKDCAKDNTIALFSCSEKYADMCKIHEYTHPASQSRQKA